MHLALEAQYQQLTPFTSIVPLSFGAATVSLKPEGFTALVGLKVMLFHGHSTNCTTAKGSTTTDPHTIDGHSTRVSNL